MLQYHVSTPNNFSSPQGGEGGRGYDGTTYLCASDQVGQTLQIVYQEGLIRVMCLHLHCLTGAGWGEGEKGSCCCDMLAEM